MRETGRQRAQFPSTSTTASPAAGGVRSCNGCEGRLAGSLDADQSMAGIVTRVSRTEYTLQIVVRDARTGAIVSDSFTGLRMGANYAWPRGVKWLMDNRILSARHGRPLRWPLGLAPEQLQERRVVEVRRRGKYLLLQLDEGVLLALERTIAHLQEEGFAVCEDSVRARAFLLSERKSS